MQNHTTNGQRPAKFTNWLYGGAWRIQCAVLSPRTEIRFVRRPDELSGQEFETLCAHIRELFDADAERLAALTDRAAA